MVRDVVDRSDLGNGLAHHPLHSLLQLLHPSAQVALDEAAEGQQEAQRRQEIGGPSGDRQVLRHELHLGDVTSMYDLWDEAGARYDFS